MATQPTIGFLQSKSHHATSNLRSFPWFFQSNLTTSILPIVHTLCPRAKSPLQESRCFTSCVSLSFSHLRPALLVRIEVRFLGSTSRKVIWCGLVRMCSGPFGKSRNLSLIKAFWNKSLMKLIRKSRWKITKMKTDRMKDVLQARKTLNHQHQAKRYYSKFKKAI